MVNIQAIVYVRNTRTYAFNSLAGYWAHAFRTSTEAHKVKLAKYRETMDKCAAVIARKYNVSPLLAENVVVVFGTIKDTISQIKDVAIRELIFDLDNRIVVEIKDTVNSSYNVATVHREYDYEVITTACTQKVIMTPDNES